MGCISSCLTAVFVLCFVLFLCVALLLIIFTVFCWPFPMWGSDEIKPHLDQGTLTRFRHLFPLLLICYLTIFLTTLLQLASARQCPHSLAEWHASAEVTTLFFYQRHLNRFSTIKKYTCRSQVLLSEPRVLGLTTPAIFALDTGRSLGKKQCPERSAKLDTGF